MKFHWEIVSILSIILWLVFKTSIYNAAWELWSKWILIKKSSFGALYCKRGSASKRSGEKTSRGGGPAGPRGSSQEPDRREPGAADSWAHAWASQGQRTQQLNSSLKYALACLQSCSVSTAHAYASAFRFPLPAPLRRSPFLCEADAYAFCSVAIIHHWSWCQVAAYVPQSSCVSFFLVLSTVAADHCSRSVSPVRCGLNRVWAGVFTPHLYCFPESLNSVKGERKR